MEQSGKKPLVAGFSGCSGVGSVCGNCTQMIIIRNISIIYCTEKRCNLAFGELARWKLKNSNQCKSGAIFTAGVPGVPTGTQLEKRIRRGGVPKHETPYKDTGEQT